MRFVIVLNKRTWWWLFTRTNILACRFTKCSVDVKIALYKAYCISLYDAGLWRRYKVSSFNKYCHPVITNVWNCSLVISAEIVWRRFCFTWEFRVSIPLYITVDLFLIYLAVISVTLLSCILSRYWNDISRSVFVLYFYYFTVFYCVCLFCLSSLCIFICMCICSYGPRCMIQINGWMEGLFIF